MTVGWKLDRTQREALLAQFPPRYARAIADHVTLLADRHGGRGAPLPPAVASARIVGRADDNAGVEAMVVEIDGSLDRPDGSTWHVTWSLAEGRKARESNDVIAAGGFEPLGPVDITVEPARF